MHVQFLNANLYKFYLIVTTYEKTMVNVACKLQATFSIVFSKEPEN